MLIKGGVMDTSFHYMMMVFQSHFSKRIMDELGKLGLTTGQPKVIEYLSEHNGSVQKDIAAGCCIDRATLTGILSRMEEKGLITRCSETGNRRSLHVYLTDKGKEYIPHIKAVFQKNEKVAFEGVDEDMHRIFNLTLSKILNNLTNTEELQ